MRYYRSSFAIVFSIILRLEKLAQTSYYTIFYSTQRCKTNWNITGKG